MGLFLTAFFLLIGMQQQTEGMERTYSQYVPVQYTGKQKEHEYVLLHQQKGHAYEVRSVSLSSDGKRMASGSNDRTVCIWDVTSRKLIQKVLIEHYRKSIGSVSLSSDGKRMASGSNDGTVHVFDVASGQAIQIQEKVNAGGCSAVSLSQDGKKVASGNSFGRIRISDLADRKKSIREFVVDKINQYPVWSVAWSPEDSNVLASCSGNTIRIWDTALGKLIQTFKGHTGQVSSVAWSPQDKNKLVSASYDKTIRTWDIALGKPIQILKGHTGQVLSVACSSQDKNKLVSGSWDKTVRMWDMAGDKEPINRKLIEHTGGVLAVDWSSNGEMIAAGSQDGVIYTWKKYN